MKWLLLGALLGLLAVFPTLRALVVAVVTAVAPQPVLIAFVLGLAARPYLPRPGRRTA
ncbi:hypothetical protein [Streptomyces sp. NPDC002845]